MSAWVTEILRPLTAPSAYVVRGWRPARGRAPASRSAGLSTTSPETTPGSHSLRWASVPWATRVGTAQARVSQTGRRTA